MKLIFFIVAFIKALDFIYLFQIKEYRADRFKTLVREEGIGKLFYLRWIRFPAFSVRNIGIALFSLAFLLFLLQILNDVGLIFFLVLPAFSFTSAAIGTAATALPVSIYRGLKISQAQKIMAGSGAVTIGITGSYGKTSVKEFLFHILSLRFRTAKTDENMNSDIGVALSVLRNVKKDTQFFIAEMGAYRKGEIRKICETVHPKIGVVTAIGNQHLDLFGSVEWLVAAKSELVEALPKKGILYINEKLRFHEQIVKKAKCPVVSYSLSSKADISAEILSADRSGSSARIHYKSQIIEIHTRILGKHNILNLLPAVAIASDLGMSAAEIARAIQSLKPVPHRLELMSGPDSSLVLDDSYNSNVEGFTAAIEVAESLAFPKTIIASRGIIELGEEKTASYTRIIERLPPNVELWTTDPLFKTITKAKNIRLFSSEKEMAHQLLPRLDKKTLLLIEGKFPRSFLKSLDL